MVVVNIVYRFQNLSLVWHFYKSVLLLFLCAGITFAWWKKILPPNQIISLKCSKITNQIIISHLLLISQKPKNHLCYYMSIFGEKCGTDVNLEEITWATRINKGPNLWLALLNEFRYLTAFITKPHKIFYTDLNN